MLWEELMEENGISARIPGPRVCPITQGACPVQRQDATRRQAEGTTARWRVHGSSSIKKEKPRMEIKGCLVQKKKGKSILSFDGLENRRNGGSLSHESKNYRTETEVTSSGRRRHQSYRAGACDRQCPAEESRRFSSSSSKKQTIPWGTLTQFLYS